jgi:hypothetical protein
VTAAQNPKIINRDCFGPRLRNAKDVLGETYLPALANAMTWQNNRESDTLVSAN